MRGKIGIFFSVVLCLALVAGVGYYVVSRDTEGPEIIVSNQMLSYTEGQDKSELLAGVTAVDEKDGDVSDSLVVETVKPGKTGDRAIAVYVAMDSHSNVTRMEYEIAYQGGDSSTLNTVNPVPGGEEAEITEAPQESTEPPVSEEPEGENGAEGDADETALRQQAEADIAALPAGSPVVRLSQYSVTLSTRDTFNYANYIDSITDDHDTRDELYGGIQVDRSDLDMSQPGTYDVTYRVVDSNGNGSNTAHLRIIIQ